MMMAAPYWLREEVVTLAWCWRLSRRDGVVVGLTSHDCDLVIGGTTPSLALLRQVKAETGLPVRALLRPRFGDFCYDRYELAQMEQSAAELVEAGANGIVTGVLLTASGAAVAFDRKLRELEPAAELPE